jgi:phosphomannomutase
MEVSLSRIKINCMPDKQWPQGNPNCPEQQTEWKENPKWLRETEREKFIRLHDPAGKIDN